MKLRFQSRKLIHGSIGLCLFVLAGAWLMASAAETLSVRQARDLLQHLGGANLSKDQVQIKKIEAGAVEYVRVARVTNLVRLIEELKERGIWVVGVEGGTEVSYNEFDFNVPLALVMGSEGKGVRRLVREKCDAMVSIPMRGQVNSLNVSVATGVVLFEVLRQRRVGQRREL
jgi:tRNA G18 (ribose-2'-O)-methylase SpoU